MRQQDSFWFRVGESWERSRSRGSRTVARLQRPQRLQPAHPGRSRRDPQAVEEFLAKGVASAVSGLLRASGGRGSAALLRGGAAGAAAAFLRTVARTWTAGGSDSPTSFQDHLLPDLLEGTGQGFIYAALLERHIPGPPALRGALAGVLDYLVSPLGGVEGVLGTAAPQRGVPVVQELFSAEPRRARPLSDYLIFGVALGLFYGSMRERRGITRDE